MKVKIRWVTKDKQEQKAIREELNLPFFMTINKITICEVNETALARLGQLEAVGTIKLLT